MAVYHLDQIFNLGRVKELLEAHHRLSGMACTLADTEENILIEVGWQGICLRFHRANPVTCAFCRESDTFVKGHVHHPEEAFLEYSCKNGMINIAMPIVIKGEHVASFITGQFFYADHPPDRAMFMEQGRALGFEEEHYLKALEEVPLFDREHVRSYVDFLHNIVQVLAETGMKNLLLAGEMEERKRAEQSLRENQVLLRTLATRQEAAREEERRKLALELHDELGQYLSALRIKVNLLGIGLGKAGQDAEGAISSLLGLVDQTIQVTRNVASSLRPATLDMGIIPALEWLAAEFTRNTGIPCDLVLPRADITLGEEKAVAMFRVAQESLTNAARHAKAGKIQVVFASEPGAYVLEVKDDGIGFDTDAPRKPQSFGLMGVKERTLAVGGEVVVLSQPGMGTVVLLRIPSGQETEVP